MLAYAIAIFVALVIPLVTRGSYGRLFGVRWHFGTVLFAGLAIQIVLEYVTIPREHWHDLGFGLLVASYVLILAFAARNLVLRGMGIVLIGIACNALVITLNQGMPVKFPAEWKSQTWTQATVKHHPQQPDDKLRFLSDIIVLKSPFDCVLSFGDLILLVGLCDVAYNASRKLRPRGSRRADNQGDGAGSTHASDHADDGARSHTRRRSRGPRREPIDLTDEVFEPLPEPEPRPVPRASGARDGPAPQNAFQRDDDPFVVDVRRRRPQRLDREIAGDVVTNGEVVVLARDP